MPGDDDAMVTTVRQLMSWNTWANRLVRDALVAAGGEPLPALRAFQHIFETELTWLRRIDGAANAGVPLWGEASLEQALAWQAEAEERGAAIAAALGGGALERTFTYRNSTGREFTDTVLQALMQTLLHSQQYRGESAAALNAAGQRVPDFDYIFWQRM